MAATAIQTPSSMDGSGRNHLYDATLATQAFFKAQMEAYLVVAQYHANAPIQYMSFCQTTPGYAKLLPGPAAYLPAMPIPIIASPAAAGASGARITLIPSPIAIPQPIHSASLTETKVEKDQDTRSSSPSPSPSSPSSMPELSGFMPQGSRRRRNSVPEGRVFGCDHEGCEKTFMQLAHLKIHQRKHTGERPYVCNFPDCDKSFTQLGNLKTHERKHTGEKPFKMGNMKTHELLHLGVKPFTCGIDGCDRSFSQLGNLKSHQAKVHCAEPSCTGSRKRSISPSDEEEDVADDATVKRRRPSATPESEGITNAERGAKSRRGSKEEQLLKRLKARLERDASDEMRALMLW
ncbi:hypothetical protein HDV00_002362 [Rhizophlyctis rosea]|nr:hypothetical protein HDV00_002362 [Rhizophlyctis rosea]